MGISHFFIDRPIFASVVSIFIILVGGFAYFTLPVTQYPDIAPPTIEVRATYPGASAEVVADTVATPLEQEINGVEGMIYMLSQSTGDGSVTLTVTFAPGTDVDNAQVLVQNRVAIAEPRLPEEVRRLGVVTQKTSPNLMMVVHLLSPDNSLGQLYVSNYAILRIRDVLARIEGVGNVTIFGARQYAMRVWLDPERTAELELTAGEVVDALRGHNVQVASGTLGAEPQQRPEAFALSVQTMGRLSEVDQFEDIIVKTGDDGRVVRVRDIARVELGAQDYVTNSYLNDSSAVAIAIFQRPGSNALDTAEQVLASMAELSQVFPEGLAYEVVYNPTEFVEESIREVIKTIFEAVILVVFVIILFLKSWRAAVIPIVAIPISLIGTFMVMSGLGFSLNNLSLFGLVLAIGIVVDDAIIVVENVERNLRRGYAPKEAAHRTMDEVGSALIASTLVLFAVFIPSALLTGITGQFYRQFALTIATSTGISLLVSVTLSPALAALLLKPHEDKQERGRFAWAGAPFRTFARGFDRAFDGLSNGYAWIIARLARIIIVMLVAYVGLIGLTAWTFQTVPGGFIPQQDQGYFITAVQLPPGSSLARTDDVVLETAQRLRSVEGVANTVAFAGFDGATFTNAPNAGAIFVTLEPFEERLEAGLTAGGIFSELMGVASTIQRANVLVIQPPPVQGVGQGGGFKLYVEDRAGSTLERLEAVTGQLVQAANQDPRLVGVFSFFNTGTPQIFAEIDRTRAEMLDIPIGRVFETLETYIGSTFVNDLNLFGRTFRVTAQADAPFRDQVDDVADLRTRSDRGEMVPLGSLATFRDISGAYRVPRYNLYPAAEVQGSTVPGVSTGEAIAIIEEMAPRILPQGFAFEWTELALQEKQQGNTAIYVFIAAVVFVFLLLAAQYESLSLPLAIILIVPMCILAAMVGIMIRGLAVDLLVQIGLVVLVAMAAKNAILIVEFARQAEERGANRREAAVEAARTRLRPILMTAFAFILGVVPLVIATGAGAEMRQSLGTAVFSGMIGVTLFGLIFTPLFYIFCRWLVGRGRERREEVPEREAAAQPAQ